MSRSGKEKLREALPKGALFGSVTLLVAWPLYSALWPLRLPELEANVEKQSVAMPARAETVSFESSKVLIRSKDLFAPPVPILSNAAGVAVVEELLKKIQLSGITNLAGQPAAIIRVSGKGGVYKAGDPLGNFVVKEIHPDKVVLEMDGQPVDLTM
jgi:type II secretory pathway component PulC